MNATKHIEQDDLALFAMQLLSPDEASAIALHVDHCAECRHELAALQGDLAIYAHTVELHSPAALSRERLMKQVAREKKIVPIDRTAERTADRTADRTASAELHIKPDAIFRSTSYLEDEEQPRTSAAARVLPWVGWAAAAALAVTAGNFYNQRNALRSTVASDAGNLARLSADAAAARQLMDTMNDSTAMRVSLNKAQTTPVTQGRVTYVADKGSLIFLASNMEPLQVYKTYELWLIPADGRDPIPAGTFQPDTRGNASVIMPELPKGVEAKAFGVTIEDAGGAKTPTLPIIMVGA